MTTDTLMGGFTDPARQSARAFRACLTALSRPGHIEVLSFASPPAPMCPGFGALRLHPPLLSLSSPLSRFAHDRALPRSPPLRRGRRGRRKESRDG